MNVEGRRRFIMQFHNGWDFVGSYISDQEVILEGTQQNHRPQLAPPNLFLVGEQEAPFNADMLALTEQITQQLPTVNKKHNVSLRAVVLIALVLVGALFFIWRPAATPTPAPTITQQSFSSTASTGNIVKNTSSGASGQIQVYIVGAVKNPGIYRMAAGARVYQLLQDAGGPLPDANLVALNLAARLSDGQEVYVAKRGETQPGSSGNGTGSSGSTAPTAPTSSTANINTASVAELEQQLHIARSTAQNIVNYRQQHGDYTSVDQLLRVVRKTTYDKIKGMVTV
jgi:competence protein ComEA